MKQCTAFGPVDTVIAKVEEYVKGGRVEVHPAPALPLRAHARAARRHRRARGPRVPPPLDSRRGLDGPLRASPNRVAPQAGARPRLLRHAPVLAESWPHRLEGETSRSSPGRDILRACVSRRRSSSSRSSSAVAPCSRSTSSRASGPSRRKPSRATGARRSCSSTSPACSRTSPSASPSALPRPACLCSRGSARSSRRPRRTTASGR